MNGESGAEQRKREWEKEREKAQLCIVVVLCWLRGVGGRCGTTTHCL